MHHIDRQVQQYDEVIELLRRLLCRLLTMGGANTLWVDIARMRGRLLQEVLNLSPARRDELHMDPNSVICLF